MRRTPEQLVDDYLRRLERELDDLPRARRREVVAEISEHIDEARAEPGSSDETGTLNVLERLGDPAEIAAETRERFDIEPKRGGRSEVAALVLLLFGGFIFGVGWFVGLILLWSSEVWTLRDKLIGTFVLPGGLAVLPFVLLWSASSELCTSDSQDAVASCSGGSSAAANVAWIVLLITLIVLPFLTMIYLALRMRTRSTVAVAA